MRNILYSWGERELVPYCTVDRQTAHALNPDAA